MAFLSVCLSLSALKNLKEGSEGILRLHLILVHEENNITTLKLIYGKTRFRYYSLLEFLLA